MKIMMRSSSNDLFAMITAQAIEDVGGTVFSITHDGMHQPQGAMIPSSKFIVWAKVKDEKMIAKADDAIEKGLNEVYK